MPRIQELVKHSLAWGHTTRGGTILCNGFRSWSSTYLHARLQLGGLKSRASDSGSSQVLICMGAYTLGATISCHGFRNWSNIHSPRTDICDPYTRTSLFREGYLGDKRNCGTACLNQPSKRHRSQELKLQLLMATTSKVAAQHSIEHTLFTFYMQSFCFPKNL